MVHTNMICAWCDKPIEPGPRWKLHGDLGWSLHLACLDVLYDLALLSPVFDVEYEEDERVPL